MTRTTKCGTRPRAPTCGTRRARRGRWIDVPAYRRWHPTALRPMCEALGLKFNGQLAKVKTKRWATMQMICTVAEDGKPREMASLHLESIPMWLATLDSAHVSAATRLKLERYQCEAAAVLSAHFLPPAPKAAAAVDPVPANGARSRRDLTPFEEIDMRPPRRKG